MVNYDLKRITTVIFDVDGVLSRSTIQLSPEGMPVRTVNIKDGYAIQLAVKLGLRLCIITGGKDDGIMLRYSALGMKDIYMAAGIKIKVLEDYMQQHNLCKEEIAYVGDDIPDYEVMQRVGLPCCPADACPDIKAISKYVIPCHGGMGCARDILEQILRAQGKWLTSEKAFGW